MSRRKCCCYPGVCLIDTDLFTLDDGTDIGLRWEEKSGDWSIDTNELAEAGTSGAVVVTAQQLNRPSYVSFHITGITSGAKPRIIVGYQDQDNYFFVEIECSGVLALPDIYDYTLRLYKRTAGFNDLLLSKALTGQWPGVLGLMSAYVYLTDEFFTACQFPDYEHDDTSTSHFWVCDPGLFSGATQVGFGNGGTDPVWFDNWSWWNMWEYAGDKWGIECAICQCLCDRNCIPMTVAAEFIDASGCDDIDETFSLTHIPGTHNWDSTDDGVVPPYGPCNQTVTLFCGADPDDPEDYILNIWPLSVGWAPGDYKANPGSTCDPLWLEFGPISGNYHVPPASPETICGADCDVFDGTFMVEITEP